MTKLEIIDSAIKIGLGATITGIASYYIARESKSKDILKEKLVEEIKLFKEIVDKIESFHHILMEYVYAYPIKNSELNFPAGSLAQDRILAQKKYLEDHVNVIQEKRITTQKSVQQLIIARTNLHLLGYTEAISKLNHYKKAAELFWLETTKEGAEIAKDRYLELKESISTNHHLLYNALAEKFPLGKK